MKASLFSKKIPADLLPDISISLLFSTFDSFFPYIPTEPSLFIKILPAFVTSLFPAKIPIEEASSPVIMPFAVLFTSKFPALPELFSAIIPTDDVLPELIFILLLFSKVSTPVAPASTSPYIPTFLVTELRFIIPSFKVLYPVAPESFPNIPAEPVAAPVLPVIVITPFTVFVAFEFTVYIPAEFSCETFIFFLLVISEPLLPNIPADDPLFTLITDSFIPVALSTSIPTVSPALRSITPFGWPVFLAIPFDISAKFFM